MKHTFILYCSGRIGAAGNCLYPSGAAIDNLESFRAAVSHDYVAVEYKNGYRSTDNFIKSDCLVMDCDNDHSENPSDWVTPADIRDALPDVAFGVHYSRNNGKKKNGKAARPRFHCFFPIPEQTDPAVYSEMKRQVRSLFPFFDPNAVDAARFFFGTTDGNVELFDGDETVDTVLAEYLPGSANTAKEPDTCRVIPEGTRNSAMSRFAAKILKRLGDSGDAYLAFLAESEKCDPPLDGGELAAIWKSALSFYKKISAQKEYIPPGQYGEGFRWMPEDLTDVGQAKVLAKEYALELRYSPSTDFICYNGVYWEESAQRAQGVAQKLTDNQLAEARAASDRAMETMKKNGAVEILATSGKKKAESLFSKDQYFAFTAFQRATEYENFVLKRRDTGFISAALKEARPMLLISPQSLDADAFLLCTPDATYDLRKGLAGKCEHRPQDFITKCTAVSPSEQGAEL